MRLDEGFALGIIAGEGSFSTQIQKQSSGVYVYPVFVIGMHADEVPLLTRVRGIIGEGTIYEYDDRCSLRYKNSDEVDAIIRFVEANKNEAFNASLTGQQYEEWKGIVAAKQAGCDAEELIRLGRGLNNSDAGQSKDAEEWIAEHNA